MYAIVDIETTGGSSANDKVTEIAVLIHDGHRITDEFITLINPEREIPGYITALTGITNEMVADAPRFYEVARNIVELTENKTFVAHNVSFDYNFIRSEFRNLGYKYQREQLCTVRLSRRLIPGLKSYSLGFLCGELGIEIHNRHRAAGDAFAAARLFDILLDLNNTNGLDLFSNRVLLNSDLHPGLSVDLIRNLPEETGVYYFYNDNRELIYVGKSRNIKSRVISHINNNSSKRAIQMRQLIADIDYVLTGSELIALLREYEEIRNRKPLYNSARVRILFQYGLYHYSDEKGYIRFNVEKNNAHNRIPLYSFSSEKEGTNTLNKLIGQYHLCQKLCGLYESSGPCFHYEIMECNGACIDKESPEDYNKRASRLIHYMSVSNCNTIIVDRGRSSDEYSIIRIKNGKYAGYGYIDRDIQLSHPDIVDDFIDGYNDYRDIRYIIEKYLNNNRVFRIIEF